jgi:hypothetical protein
MDPTTLAGLMGGGTNIVGAGIGAISQYMAAQQQLNAAKQAGKSITGAYNTAQGYQQPYLQAGQQGLQGMMTGNYDVNTPQYNAGDIPQAYQAQQFNYEQDPGMAYRMQTGQQAVNAGAAGQGAGLSGATLKALAMFGQNLGSQEYGAAFGRYNTNRAADLAGYQTNLGRAQDIRDTGWGAAKDMYTAQNQQATQRFGRNETLGNYGQTAAGNMSNLASDYGMNMANLYGQAGNVRANRNANIGESLGNLASGLGAGLGAYAGAGGFNPSAGAKMSRNAGVKSMLR